MNQNSVQRPLLSQDVDEPFLNSTTAATDHRQPAVPKLFLSLPPIRDALVTETSIVQDEIVQTCLPFLAGTESGSSPFALNAYGLPYLERHKHVRFLHASLQTLPSGFTGYDASRPWIVYWALAGLSLLGEDISVYRERVIQAFTAAQHPEGGFGGGHGQSAHIAPSYAAVLSLAMVGGREALEVSDRRSLWRWLGKLKQPDGGFSVSQGGEIDVRGAYCAMVLVSLLRLPLDLPQDAPARKFGKTSFLDGLPEWLSRCQTYEGGISGCPGTEAHGAYAFCALACLCILGRPQIYLAKYFNLSLLTSWISARQYGPEGGFAGRTNKLVDACYSHWAGGCWPFLEAALRESSESEKMNMDFNVRSLYSREALIRYILSCCQSTGGGLRDKPGKHADAYHSCYALAGLSSAQHGNEYDLSAEPEPNEVGYAFAWMHSDAGSLQRPEDERVFEEEDTVEPIHPVYVIPFAAVEQTRAWFRNRNGVWG